MVRGVVRAGAEPHEPRLRRIAGLLIANHRDRLVGEVLGEVVALLRAVRLVDEPVVLDEVRIPVVGLAAEEAVEAIETFLERPLLAAGAGGNVLLGDVVVLAQPERAEAVLLENLADGGALGGKAAVRAGKSVGTLRDAGHAVDVMVASGQKRGPGGRTQRRRVPLRVHQAVVGQLLQRRHVDLAAERRPGGQTRIVIQDDQHVRRSRGRFRLFVRTPVRFGVANIQLDDTLEWFAHDSILSRRLLQLLFPRAGNRRRRRKGAPVVVRLARRRCRGAAGACRRFGSTTTCIPRNC